MTISDIVELVTYKYKGWVIDDFMRSFPEPGSFVRLKQPRTDIVVTFEVGDSEVEWILDQVPVEGIYYEDLMATINVLEHIKQDIENSLFY